MRRILYPLLSVVLLIGSVVAWTSVVQDAQRFIAAEGTLFKIQDCASPNPVATPCFYGAIAFVLALIWSVRILRGVRARRGWSHRHLLLFLVACNVFAWTVNANELIKFYGRDTAGPAIGCSGQLVTNPYTTACFLGASLFLTALVVSVLVAWRERRTLHSIHG